MANNPTTPPPSLREAAWLQDANARRVFSALNVDGHTARAVGGAVRNALLGEPVRDVDIATTAPPDVTMQLAARAGLKAIPTGIDHGTVTVLAEHTPFEVTTLRKDVETFGRHARVAFTDDWAADARRRDFTINALYCDAAGTVFDPLGGYPDLAARKVRFIGNAEDRIREDYLRILRFFRFSAEYAEGRLDPAGLDACRALAPELDQLSRERVRAELLRLLTAADAPAVVPAISSEILGRLVPGTLAVPLFSGIATLEGALSRPADAILRLGALAGAHPGIALTLKDALRLSSREFERIARMSIPDPGFDPREPEHAAKIVLYRHGPEAFDDGVLLHWARSGAPPSDSGYRDRLSLASRWTVPTLPVRGSDILELGVQPGPRVSPIMAAFEDWWIGTNFPHDPQRLAARLAELVTETNDGEA